MAAQISRFSTHPRRKMIKSLSEQIDGDAHLDETACPSRNVKHMPAARRPWLWPTVGR